VPARCADGPQHHVACLLAGIAAIQACQRRGDDGAGQRANGRGGVDRVESVGVGLSKRDRKRALRGKQAKQHGGLERGYGRRQLDPQRAKPAGEVVLPVVRHHFGEGPDENVARWVAGADQIGADAWRAAEGAEAIVYKYSWLTGYTIAEKLGLPRAAAMPFPLTPTRAFPAFLLGSGTDRGTLGNKLTWAASEQVVWQLLRIQDSRLRHEHGMPPMPLRGPLTRQQGEALPVYYAYSPAVLPRPADWPARIQVTGYWFLDPPPGWRPPDDLRRFLESGPPPVSVGFGSMASADQEATLVIVLRALEKSGQRGLLLSGWADLGEGRSLPPHVLRVGSVPHAWLFPRVAAVVHHGGAGTTGAALRAGVPSVVLPLAADQPSWARIVHSLGAGPVPIPFRKLTAERLAAAIRGAVSDGLIRQRAAELGRQVRAEDGTGRAVELFLRDVVGSRRNGH
jgi:sterol 3beta-glucosyltransferase